jgi:hypothetical protein
MIFVYLHKEWTGRSTIQPQDRMFITLKILMRVEITKVVVLPISKGYAHGEIAYFVATDASNNETANSIFENTGWRVNFAPFLTQVPNGELSQGYEFLNGIRGQGAFGFQLPVASSTPDDENYTPLVHLNLVRWNENATTSILKSAPEIILANHKGDLQIIPTNITINSPAVIW